MPGWAEPGSAGAAPDVPGAAAQEQAALGAPHAGSQAMAGLPGAATPPLIPRMPVVPLLENYDLPPPGSAVDVMVDHLKVLAEKEPERVAEVVKQWMQKNGRTQ